MSDLAVVTETVLSGLSLLRRGKVRDVYEVDAQRLLIVATDRISAFDCILPTPVPGKGIILTALSRFWCGRFASFAPHHLLTTELDEMPVAVRAHAGLLRGRAMLTPVCVYDNYDVFKVFIITGSSRWPASRMTPF